jgi:hypothetical protein
MYDWFGLCNVLTAFVPRSNGYFVSIPMVLFVLKGGGCILKNCWKISNFNCTTICEICTVGTYVILHFVSFDLM